MLAYCVFLRLLWESGCCTWGWGEGVLELKEFFTQLLRSDLHPHFDAGAQRQRFGLESWFPSKR